MKQNKDTKFWLITFFEEQEQTKPEYKSFQRQIENNGCFFKVKPDTVKIFTPELALIFFSKELSARNMDTQTDTKINGWEYLKTYITAYKEGEQYFEADYKVSPNTLYGANAEQYVRDIHLNFFHVKHTGTNEGWGYVKKQYPIILSHEVVREYGYYSGITNKVEEQVKKYPRLFADFDKCEHNLPPQQTEMKTEQETPTFVNNFDKIAPFEIYKHFKAGLVDKNYLTLQELNEYLKAAFELKIKPEILFKIKDAPKKTTIEAVFYKYYKNVAGKIHGKQNQYAALLGDYFEGYNTTTVSSNFSKSVY
jgi:hypothetical protein